jgi:ArsR family transcriptional regulator
MRKLAGIFRALADETRLRMMGLLLRRRELCVCDFVGVLGITQSKASRHLRYLLHAGLVDDRRAGPWVHYRLAHQLGPDPRAVVRDLRSVLTDERLGELQARLDRWLADKVAPDAGCCAARSRRPAGRRRTTR